MSGLTRTVSGAFSLERSLQPEKVKQMSPEEIEAYLLPVDYPLIHFGKCTMPKDRALYFASGNSIRWHQVTVTKEPQREILARQHITRCTVCMRRRAVFFWEQAITMKKRRL